MSLKSDGCSENIDLQKFYQNLLKNNEQRAKLINCATIEDFSRSIMELAKEQGYVFSRQELDETFSPFGGGCDIVMGDQWIQKIMEMGWSPLGYSR